MKFKVWLVQMESKPCDKKGNADKIVSYLDKAVKAKASLVAFPECSLTGYLIREKSWELAEPIPGPSTQEIMEKAKKEGIYVVLGMPELDNAYVYNSAPMFGPEGLVGIYRKLFLPTFWTPMLSFEEDVFFKPGLNPVTFDTELGRIGVIICRDIFFAEAARAHALRGALLIICIMGAPLAFDPTMRIAHIFAQARALENAAWFAVVNIVGRQGTIYFSGGTLIANNLDEIVKMASMGKDAKEEIVEVELDTEAMLRARIAANKVACFDMRPSILRKVADIAEQY